MPPHSPEVAFNASVAKAKRTRAPLFTDLLGTDQSAAFVDSPIQARPFGSSR